MIKRPSTRKLLLILVMLAGVAATGAVAQRARMRADIVEQDRWPTELRELLPELERSGVAAEDIDVRSTGLVMSYCWTMPANSQTLDLHVKRFGLSRVGTSGIEVRRIHDRFPMAWTWPGTDDVECFAAPVGLPGPKEGEFEFVLLHDKATKRLYFYYYFYF